MPRVVPPVFDHYDRFFWDGAAEGRLLVKRCSSCGCLRHPPVPMCPHCRSLAWEPFECTGRGRVYSWILSRHPNEPDAEPRLVALVDLDEGVRLVSNLVGL